MKKSGAGFTIVETMIVLAISGVMLTITIVLFSGQQQRAQFEQGVRNLESRVSDAANDVSIGNFSALNQKCTLGGSGIELNSLIVPEQGTQSQCVFLGKAIKFNKSSMDIYSIVGARQTPGGKTPKDFVESSPLLVGPPETYSYTFGFTATKVVPEGSALIAYTTTTGKFRGNTNTSTGAQGLVQLKSLTGTRGQPDLSIDNANPDDISAIRLEAWSDTTDVFVCLAYDSGPIAPSLERVLLIQSQVNGGGIRLIDNSPLANSGGNKIC